MRTRLPGDRLDQLVALLLILFVAVTLGPGLLGRGTMVDVDALTRILPFRVIDGVQTTHTIVCRGDTWDFYLPGIEATKRGLLAGHLPTWAPYEVGGTPLASLPNHGVLSPLSLPYFVLPIWLAPVFVKLGEFVVGIGGMFLFLRRHGVSRASSALAGLLFVSSGFMIMWTNWPHTKVTAFVPLLFWALECMVQRRCVRDVVVLALVVASMLLGGFPAVTLYALSLAGVYVVVRAVTVHRTGLAALAGLGARAAAGVGLGVGLAAVQILPFAHQLGALDLAGREDARRTGHLGLGLFLTTVAPNAVGECVNGERYTTTNPIEAVGFLGAAAMVLVVVALLRRGPRGTPGRDLQPYLLVAAAVVAVLVWVGGPLLALVQGLPFYSANFIGRAQSVFGFLAACLAGLGLDALRRAARAPTPGDDTDRWRPRDLVGGGLVLAVVTVVGVLVIRAAHGDAVDRGYTAHLAAALRVPGLLLLGAVVAVLVTWYGPRRVRPWGPVLLVLLAVAQSTSFAHTMLPLSNRSNLYPVTPTHAFLKAHLGGERYGAGDHTMHTATSDWYELRTPDGHEFTDPRWADLIAAVDPKAALSATYSRWTNLVTIPLMAESAVLDQMAVKDWVSSPRRVPGRVDAPSVARTDELPVGRGVAASCDVGGGALRGVAVVVARGRTIRPQAQAFLRVRVQTPEGVRTGSTPLFGRLRAGPVRVAVAGEDLISTGRYPVRVEVTGVRKSVLLAGSGDRLACAGVRPLEDRLRLVHADAGANVFERLGALPRIRWASRSEVVPDAAARVRRMTAGLPVDTVLLDDASSPAARGGTATVRVVEDEPERMAVDVTAGSQGYVVVADSLVRDGWTATVDGRRTRIVHADHAFAGVPVRSGRHRVVLTYTAPGLATGAVVSAASVVVVVLLLVVPWARRRWRASASHPTRELG